MALRDDILRREVWVSRFQSSEVRSAIVVKSNK